ncbi:MAG: NAD(P)H-dependent oxidoreductase [Lachnospiraceae bacterium]|nr:NAD(P)H-dependent oxidoreductase [Lachnospiraceae bacterium]
MKRNVATKNNILKRAVYRKAIKVFNVEKKIPQEDFEFLLKTAQYSPSSFGLEPWNILVVQNKDLREEISEFATGAQNQLRTASHFVIFTVKKDLAPESEYFYHINRDIKKLDEEARKKFIDSFSAFQKDKLDVYDDRTRLDWAKKQAYIAMGYMMLAAIQIGIDSCPIEGFFPGKVESVLEKKGVLDTKRDRIAVMVAFGYRDKSVSIHKKTRRKLNEIVKVID